ncbi:amidohydrolase family protein [Ornithinibacillus bavariensis]|uniref:Amidohydrolase n=1 Tax=Ornithinibacillus bavariensis TaxID=545502 RepID=A0A919X8G0_9BACI|nr:amidohydrolase family protein [Ornithinibacillus bavariensis]GIO27936.1 amidohydrolase [Ornithinibacillus bavariensis]
MAQRHYIITNATIIDVENELQFKGDIEIKGDKIHLIYKEHERLPKEVEKVDATGKFIIPGLIDMHCHIRDSFAPHYVASGVTTVRNTAGNVLQLENYKVAPTDAPIPRVYSADRMIDGPPGLWGPNSSGNFVTDNVEEAIQEVKRQVEVGADFIKVYGWISSDVMKAVVREAKRHGLEVSCDLIHSKEVNALEAAKLGVTWFEHASGFLQVLYPNWNTMAEQEEWDKIDWDNPDKERIEALCKEMLQYEVKLCPTIVITEQIEKFPNYWNPKNIVTESANDKEILGGLWENMIQHIDALKKQLGSITPFTKAVAKTYVDLGGTVVAGTDTPGGIWSFPGMALHRELEIFVDIGLTEMQALQAATIRAAQSISLYDIGVVGEHKLADLLILNENPLEDIRNTQNIYRIVKGGRIFTQEEVLATIPNPEEIEAKYLKFEKEFSEMMGS